MNKQSKIQITEECIENKMSERNLWRYLKKNIDKNKMFFLRIESGITSAGIPDLYFFNTQTKIGGWLELKYIKEYPKKESTKIKINLSGNQDNFFQSYNKIGGKCFILTQIAQDYYLFDGSLSDILKKGLAYRELLKVAKSHLKKIDFEKLINQIT